MFDDLRTELELKVQQLKEDIGDVTSLIESIKQIANDTLSKINKAQADAISAITDALLSSTNSIDLERDEALRQIDTKRAEVKPITIWRLILLISYLMTKHKHLTTTCLVQIRR